MYNIAFTGLLVFCTVATVDLNQSSKVILQSVGVLWASFFSSLAFVLPRLLQVQRHVRELRSSTINLRSTIGGSNIKISGVHSSALNDSTNDIQGDSQGTIDRMTLPTEEFTVAKFGDTTQSVLENIDSTLSKVNESLVEENTEIGTKGDVKDYVDISMHDSMTSTTGSTDDKENNKTEPKHVETEQTEECV